MKQDKTTQIVGINRIPITIRRQKSRHTNTTIELGEMHRKSIKA
jgi:hypothetical protein